MTQMAGQVQYKPNSDANDAVVSLVVRALLDDRRQSIPELAAATDINQSSLYLKMDGVRKWTASEVLRVAQHFGVTPNDLFGL